MICSGLITKSGDMRENVAFPAEGIMGSVAKELNMDSICVERKEESVVIQSEGSIDSLSDFYIISRRRRQIIFAAVVKLSC